MGFDLNKLHISHSLENHPILGESTKYKEKYLFVLEYFTLKYSLNDSFSLAMLNNYKKTLLGEDYREYSLCNNELEEVVKKVFGTKFKGFKLFPYRYSLLFDCLFLNAFNDQKKAEIITNDIKGIYNARYHHKLDQIMSILFQNDKYTDGMDLIKYQIQDWKKNCENISMPINAIIATATMSAGKSTLINALIGKTINKTMNDACTAKLHHILDKSYEDNFTYELDHELNLDASYETIMNDNHFNMEDEVFVSTFFRTVGVKTNRLRIIDTPGVNSTLNKEHALIAINGVLNQSYNRLIYIVNAENAGTNDDFNYLTFIKENIDNEKVIFVLNKLDRFRLKEDSVEECICNLSKDLAKIGYENPMICPVSSYAGVLAKKKIYKEKLTEDEIDDYDILKRKFNKEEFDLAKYYPKNTINAVSDLKDKYTAHHQEEINLLFNSGLLCLEHIIAGEEKL